MRPILALPAAVLLASCGGGGGGSPDDSLAAGTCVGPSTGSTSPTVVSAAAGQSCDEALAAANPMAPVPDDAPQPPPDDAPMPVASAPVPMPTSAPPAADAPAPAPSDPSPTIRPVSDLQALPSDGSAVTPDPLLIPGDPNCTGALSIMLDTFGPPQGQTLLFSDETANGTIQFLNFYRNQNFTVVLEQRPALNDCRISVVSGVA